MDAALSSAEVAIDVLTHDDLISSIPVLGLAVKMLKALDSTRDRQMAVKLHRFLVPTEALSPEQRTRLATKLTADDQGRKAADTLLLLLDRLSDLDKPALLGLLLVRFGDGRIDAAQLRRLATAIDTAFADDLIAFLEESASGIDKHSNASHREGLLASGLTRLLSGDTIDSVGQMYFGITDTGRLLHAMIREE